MKSSTYDLWQEWRICHHCIYMHMSGFVRDVMLPYSGKRSFRFKGSDWLARAGQCASVLRNMSLKNGFRYVLLNPLLQPLRSTTHVPTITVARNW